MTGREQSRMLRAVESRIFVQPLVSLARVRLPRRLNVKVQGLHHRRIAMADSPNVSVVRRLYQARGNPEVIRQVLGSEVRWEVVDGFPYGAVYEGLDSVLRDFFGRLFTDFDEFVANGSEFFESGDHV